MSSKKYFERIDSQDAHFVLDGYTVEAMPIVHSGNEEHIWIGKARGGVPFAFFADNKANTEEYSVSDVLRVSAAPGRLEPDLLEEQFVQLTCTEPTMADTFYAFLDKVIDRHKETSSNSQKIIGSVARDWREFLQRSKAPLVISEIIGLFGELSYLEKLVEQFGPEALNWWKGPSGSSHDFVTPLANVEVKTTKFQQTHELPISGFKQLLVPPGGRLVLANLEIQESAAGRSLDDISRKIIELGVREDELEKLTLNTGYAYGKSSVEEYRFSIQEWRFWEVTNNFPRLSPELIPEDWDGAINHVSYALSLSALPPPSNDTNLQTFLN